jgi:hypothetical protein
MKILLLTGGLHNIFTKFIPDKFEIINNDVHIYLSNVQDYLIKHNPFFEGVIITDQAFSGDIDSDKTHLSMLFEWIDNSSEKVKIAVITEDYMKEKYLRGLDSGRQQICFILNPRLRITSCLIDEALLFLTCDEQIQTDIKNKKTNDTIKKGIFFSLLRRR